MRQKIGEYTVIRKIGRGGMATVYEVEPKFATDGRQALKMFSCEEGNVRELKKKFMAEAEFLHKYGHPGLAHVSDLARDADPPYFVMDLVVSPSGEPKSMQDRFVEHNITSQEAVKWFGQLCDVVAFVHEKGLVHRDIKPGNILLNESNDVVLVDFGVAKIVDEATLRELRSERTMVTGATADCPAVLGTREYLPPEVIGNPVATEAWDVWAVGMVFFKILLRYSWDFTLNDVQGLRENLEGVDFANFWKEVLPQFLEKNPDLRVKGLSRFATWAKAVLEDRHVQFKRGHQPLIERLTTVFMEGMCLAMGDMNDRDLAMNSATFEDEGTVSRFFRKGLRIYAARRFGVHRDAVERFLEKCRPIMRQANDVIKAYGLPPFEFNDKWLASLRYYAPTSLDGLEYGWRSAFDDLDDGLSSVLLSIERAQKQLNLFAEGRFGESILDIERRESELRERENRKREDSIRSPVVASDSGSRRVHLTTEEIRNVPFAYNDVSSVVVFQGSWYVWQGRKCWKSADAIKWEPIALPGEMYGGVLKVVDSVLIALDAEKLFYTRDGVVWKSVKFSFATDPEAHNVFPVDLFRHQGKWQLQVSRYMPYSYVKTGFLFDTNEDDYYHSTCFYSADTLDGPWIGSDIKPSFLGEEICEGALQVVQGRLSAVSTFDYCYSRNKQIERHYPHFVFTTPDGSWANAEFKEPVMNDDKAWSRLGKSDFRLFQTPVGLLCLTWNAIFRSDDGRIWELSRFFEFSHDFKNCVIVGPVICLPECARRGRMWISLDGREFTEMSTDVTMSHVAVKGDDLLVIDTDARHGRVCRCRISLVPT